MSKRVRKRVIEEYETDDADSLDESVPRPARPRRRFRRLLVGLLLIGLLAWFAPWIAGATGAWKSLLPMAAPELAGKIDAQSLSLGWLSPIVAGDATLRDADGQPLARVKSLRTERSLLELILDTSQLGKVALESPRVLVKLRPDGSNVEDFIAALLSERSTGGPLPTFEISIYDGTIEVADTISGRRWGLEKLEAQIVHQDPEQGVTGELAAAVILAADDNSVAGRGELSAKGLWKPGTSEDDPLGSGACDVEWTDVPSPALEGILRRFAFDLRPAGSFSGAGTYEWQQSFAFQRVHITRASSRDLALALPTLLENDRVTTAVADLSGDIELDGMHVAAKNLKLKSDLAQFAGSAAVNLPSYSLAGVVQALQSRDASENFSISGQVDLARLASQLPTTLRLKSDTQITEGTLGYSLASVVADGRRTWEAILETSQLAGESGGRRIEWDKPLQVTAVIEQSREGFSIRQLSVLSSFARADGSGTLAEGQLAVNADLNQLRSELSRFIDFQGMELEGTLSADVSWQHRDGDAWSAAAGARIQNLNLAAPGVRPWQEQDLRLTADAAGILAGPWFRRLDTAQLTIESATDKLTAELTAPVDAPGLATPWPLAVAVQGDLATWMPRVQIVLPLSGWSIAGKIDLHGGGSFSPTKVVLQDAKVRIDNLAAHQAPLQGQPASAVRLAIVEPTVKIESSLTWDGERGLLVSPTTTLASTSLAFRADDLEVKFGKEISLTGLVDYRGDLARLSAWLGEDPRRTWQLGGAMVGRLEARLVGGVVQGVFSTDIDNLAYATRMPAAGGVTPAAANSPWQNAWLEPKVSLGGQVAYRPADDLLELKEARLAAAAIDVTLSGTARQCSSLCQVDLRGQLACDMASVSEKLRPLVGDTLHMTGNERRQFELRGPLLVASSGPAPAARMLVPAFKLVPDELAGRGGIGWETAEYVGLKTGRADLEAKLATGVVALDPFELAVSEGRLAAAPKLHLNQPSLPLVLGKGQLLERVRISPELCRSWLKYLSPALADATRTEGKFSLDLEGAVVPLIEPQAMDVSGRMSIHEAQIGPGPLAMKYLQVAMQVKSILSGGKAATIDPTKGWILYPEQQVEVKVAGGRVYHRGLTMHANDVVIRTEGSVGFDQTLQLVAHIPVQDKWIEKEKLPAFLKGQTIQIPIHGEIMRPQPDGRVLTELGKQIVAGAVKGTLEKGRGRLEQELQKGLQKLFNPPQPQPMEP